MEMQHLTQSRTRQLGTFRFGGPWLTGPGPRRVKAGGGHSSTLLTTAVPESVEEGAGWGRNACNGALALKQHGRASAMERGTVPNSITATSWIQAVVLARLSLELRLFIQSERVLSVLVGITLLKLGQLPHWDAGVSPHPLRY